jgi:hypothetical protein
MNGKRSSVLLTTCAEPDCQTLVLGGWCVEHDRRPPRVFVRGRPYVRQRARLATAAMSVKVRAEPLRVSDRLLERGLR